MLQSTKHAVRKSLAVLCALALIITMVPIQAHAAAKPKFSKTYKNVYDNGKDKGVYTYTVKNLTKGQTVKWSVSGTGKAYAKLQKTSTKAAGATVSNKLTVKTNGKTAAKNKTVNVTAKVYNSSGKLLYTLSAGDAKIKALATAVSIQSDALSEKQLYVGQSYQFQYKLTPANATSTNTWSVTDSSGKDVSSCISKSGLFKPATGGTYTIKVSAKNTNKTIRTDSKTVTVAASMTGVKQTAANKVTATYSGNVRELVEQKDFTLRKKTGAKADIREIAFSDDGTQVTLTTFSNLENAVEYTLSDDVKEYSFTAKIGRPVSIKALTTTVTVNKETAVEYGIYDADGIEVSSAYPGTVRYENFKITNGYVTDADNKILMTNVGDTGTFQMVYVCASDPTITLTAFCQVTCVAASIASDTHFTLTADAKAPDYTASTYKDNLKAAAGNNYYVHFQAFDSDKSPVKYDRIQYESSDPDTLLINNTGGVAQATAIKPGTVRIIVTAYYGSQNYVYTYEVTVAEPSYLTRLTADKNTVQMSNRVDYGHKEYINITAIDQYGEAFVLEDETAQIVDNSVTKMNLATYDAATNRVMIEASSYAAGSYYYTLTITCGGRNASVNFAVIIQSPPESGSVSYRIDIDAPVTDLAITGDTDLTSPKKVVIRMSEYRGGIYYSSMYIQSATVTKNGRYYSNDLTQPVSATDPGAGSGPQLSLTVLSTSGSVCTKAETGVYNVTVKFYTPQGALATASGTFELKDSQTAPKVSVAHSTATVRCSNALELVRNCLTLSNVSNAEITDCAITASADGKNRPLSSGESINIKSVTVQVSTMTSGGKVVISNFTVNVGKTLKNL